LCYLFKLKSLIRKFVGPTLVVLYECLTPTCVGHNDVVDLEVYVLHLSLLEENRIYIWMDAEEGEASDDRYVVV